jgi:hypothetical protein
MFLDPFYLLKHQFFMHTTLFLSPFLKCESENYPVFYDLLKM